MREAILSLLGIIAAGVVAVGVMWVVLVLVVVFGSPPP